MELVLGNGFEELTVDEINSVDGGDIFGCSAGGLASGTLAGAAVGGTIGGPVGFIAGTIVCAGVTYAYDHV